MDRMDGPSRGGEGRRPLATRVRVVFASRARPEADGGNRPVCTSGRMFSRPGHHSGRGPFQSGTTLNGSSVMALLTWSSGHASPPLPGRHRVVIAIYRPPALLVSR